MNHASPDKKVYYSAAGALLVLLALTVGVSYLPLGSWGPAVAMTIACSKALVIALYFMHIRYASRLTMLFAAAGIFWLLVMFALTFGDYATRG